MRGLFAAALLTASGTAAAVPVTYDFSGIVETYFQGSLPIPAGLEPANTLNRQVTGSVTYDDAAPALASGPDGGLYDAILRFSAQINGLELTYDRGTATPGSSSYVSVTNHDGDKFPDNGIDFVVNAFQPDFLAPLGSGHELAYLLLSFFSDDINAINSSALPANLPASDTDDGWGFVLLISDPTQPRVGSPSIVATTRITRRLPSTVPEPAPLPLFALGFGAWIASRRIGRRGVPTASRYNDRM